MVKKFKPIEQMVIVTLFCAIAAFIVGLFTNHFFEGLALFSGALWGAIHLFLLKVFFQRLLIAQKKDTGLLILLIVKWPLLYLAGFYLLKFRLFTPLYLLIGFSLLFAAILIVAVMERLRYEK